MPDYFERDMGLINHVPARGLVLIDIGANEGAWVLPLAKQYEYVHAFEPDARARETLFRNLDREYLNNVVVHSEAVSNHNGKLVLELFENSVHTMPVIKTAAIEREFSRVNYEQVNCITLDHFLFGRPSNILKSATIKIDVEGGELDVVNGAERTFRERDIHAFIEIHSRALHKLVHAKLESYGYVVKVVRHPDYNEAHPKYHEHLWLVAHKVKLDGAEHTG